ncbi:MAG: aminomethyl-transferring glycine dehydrogenase subunit GcvPA [Candidatus Omnitrophota bacterium]
MKTACSYSKRWFLLENDKLKYTPHTQDDKRRMLDVIGAQSVEDLLKAVPAELRVNKLNIGEGLSELELTRLISGKARKNRSTKELTSFLGGGAYEHYIPEVVPALISRGEFLTAYTPYQAEANQGILQCIYEYQSLICELTAMDVANASMYDGASALAEAVLLAVRETGKRRVIFCENLNPDYRLVLKTYLSGSNVDIVEIDYNDLGVIDETALRLKINSDTACVVIQTPNFFGCIEEAEVIEKMCHSSEALFIACVNPLSLGVLKPPGEYNADIVVGEGQPLGIALNYGGPYLGFFAVKEKYLRKMPGRIVGATKDCKGKDGFVLTLQAREQHIRREKATSNICTNAGLMALAACIYLSVMGKSGIKEVAEQNIAKSHYLKDQILKLSGYSSKFNQPFFNEFVIKCAKDPDKINSCLLKHGFIGGLSLGRLSPDLRDCVLICATETKSKEELDRFVDVLSKY